jgi:two-component sensor histidine kinase
VDPGSCARGLRDIAYGLVEIFGHTVGSLALSLEIQPLSLAGKGRRALLLAVSELVINALRHAFIDRQTGIIHIRLDHDQARQEGALFVADDGVGPGGLTQGGGQGRGIVRHLADVLDGDVVWRQSLLLGGTEVILKFPLPSVIAVSGDIAPCRVPPESRATPSRS